MSVYDDVPRTFQDMYVDPKWATIFSDWADQRSDWIGPLTRALFAMGSWDRTPQSAQLIYGELLAATPPMDAQLVAGLDPGTQQQLATDWFDEAYGAAYQVLAGTQEVYGEFFREYNQDLSDEWTERLQDQQSRPSGFRKQAVPEADRAQYVTRANLWVQPVDRPAEVVMSIEAEEDQWFEVSINQMLDVMARNKRTLDDADDGETFSFQQWFNLILIGPGHDNGLIQICNDYGVTGTVTKEKGSSWNVSDKGSLTFTGAHDTNAVEEHIRALPSKKECVFQ